MTPRRVYVPLFELVADPTILVDNVKRRKFRLIDSVCPVCQVRVQDLWRHCSDVGDNAHGVLEVMES